MQYKNLIGSEIMKRRDNLGWSQSDLAVKLQLAGWDIDRSQVSKIECRLVHVSDFQQLYFARVFKITINDLFPRIDPYESVSSFLEKTMERRRLPIPRKKRKRAGRGSEK
jgi:transcriptional regulator with XRE-family HTH domain